MAQVWKHYLNINISGILNLYVKCVVSDFHLSSRKNV